jgi:hypothetical protein
MPTPTPVGDDLASLQSWAAQPATVTNPTTDDGYWRDGADRGLRLDAEVI